MIAKSPGYSYGGKDPTLKATEVKIYISTKEKYENYN
jgi:hypothetical protein